MDTALFSLDSALALMTLTALEIVLGIDNIIFIAILTGRLPEEKQHRARIIGLTLALMMRILLLFGIFWVMQLTAPLFTIPFLTDAAGEGAAAVRVPLSISGRAPGLKVQSRRSDLPRLRSALRGSRSPADGVRSACCSEIRVPSGPTRRCS